MVGTNYVPGEVPIGGRGCTASLLLDSLCSFPFVCQYHHKGASACPLKTRFFSVHTTQSRVHMNLPSQDTILFCPHNTVPCTHAQSQYQNHSKIYIRFYLTESHLWREPEMCPGLSVSRVMTINRCPNNF